MGETDAADGPIRQREPGHPPQRLNRSSRWTSLKWADASSREPSCWSCFTNRNALITDTSAAWANFEAFGYCPRGAESCGSGSSGARCAHPLVQVGEQVARSPHRALHCARNRLGLRVQTLQVCTTEHGKAIKVDDADCGIWRVVLGKPEEAPRPRREPNPPQLFHETTCAI